MAIAWDSTKNNISQVTLPNGDIVYIKDKEARDEIDKLSAYTQFLGVTTTAIEDGTTSAVVAIGGKDVTAKKGDIVIYNKVFNAGTLQERTVAQEFIYDGEAWSLFGDLSAAANWLGDLAYNDTASADYTPEGSVSVVLNPTNATVIAQVTDAGTVPTYEATEATVIGQVTDAGTVPTFEATEATVLTGVSTAGTLPTFTPTSASVLTGVSTAGTLPSFTSTSTEVIATATQGELPTFSASLLTASVSGESLIFTLAENGFSAGTLPSFTTSNVVATTTFTAGSMPTFKEGEVIGSATFTQGAMPTFNSGSVVGSTTFDAGAMPTFSNATVVGSTTFSAGAMPTFSSTSVLSGVAVSSATFSGTASTITVSGSTSAPTV